MGISLVHPELLATIYSANSQFLKKLRNCFFHMCMKQALKLVGGTFMTIQIRYYSVSKSNWHSRRYSNQRSLLT